MVLPISQPNPFVLHSFVWTWSIKWDRPTNPKKVLMLYRGKSSSIFSVVPCDKRRLRRRPWGSPQQIIYFLRGYLLPKQSMATFTPMLCDVVRQRLECAMETNFPNLIPVINHLKRNQRIAIRLMRGLFHLNACSFGLTTQWP